MRTTSKILNLAKELSLLTCMLMLVSVSSFVTRRQRSVFRVAWQSG
jgi:hypothetical protein